MASFDASNYFNRKVQEQNSFVKSKIQQLDEAAQRKTNSLSQIFQETEEYQKQYKESNKDSWVNKLDLDPDSITGEAVNLGAAAVAGASRVGGELAALPAHVMNLKNSRGMTQAEMDAYNRYVQNIATPEDMALLSSKKSNAHDNATPAMKARAQERVDADPNSLTVLQRFQNAENARQTAADVRQRFDINSIKHNGNQQRFQNILGDGFDPAWEQTKQGARSLLDGKLIDGVSDLASGTGKLAGNVGRAIKEAPLGALETTTENLPQLALGAVGKVGAVAQLASNAGYAADTFVEGMENYRKANKGQLPSVERQKEMALDSAKLALAEEVGDLVSLDLIKKPGKRLMDTLRKGATEATEASEEVIRTGFKNALKNTTRATTGGFTSEALTEGYQTKVEGDVTGKPSSARDIFISSVLGGLSGGMLTGGGHALAESAGATENHQKLREQEAKKIIDHAGAIKSGDVSAYLDPTKSSYSPSKAIAALHGNNQQEDTTPEAKQANLEKANQILTDLQTRRNAVADELNTFSPKETDKQIQEMQSLIAKTDPTDAETIQAYQEAIQDLQQEKETLGTKENKARIAGLEKQLVKLDTELGEARKNHSVLSSNLTDTKQIQTDLTTLDSVLDTNIPEHVQAHQEAATRVITSAMKAPDSLSHEQALKIAENKGNGLSADQRSFLRTFSEARVAENNLKTSKSVLSDIYFGSKEKGKTRYVGIQEYNAQMAHAIARNDMKMADRALQGLSKLASSQQGKANLVNQMLDSVASGKVSQGQIVFNKATQEWQQAPKVYGRSDMKKLGGLTLHGNTPASLRDDVSKGAREVAKSLKAMQAAYVLYFGKPAPSSHTSVSTVNSVEKKSTQQKTVEKTVNSKEAPLAAADPSTEEGPNHYKGPKSTVDQTTSSTSGKRPEAHESTKKTEVNSVKQEQTPVQETSTDDEQISTEADTDENKAETVLSIYSSKPVREEGESLYSFFIEKKNSLVAHFTSQKKQNPELESNRPLASVKDFLTRWSNKEISLDSLVSEANGTGKDYFNALPEAQAAALTSMRTLLQDWVPSLGKLIKPKELHKDFRMKDLLQEFFHSDKDGNLTLDENVLTSMAYSGYQWVLERSNSPALLTPETINEMHGMDKNNVFDPSLHDVLKDVVGHKNMVIYGLGDAAVQALGIQANKNAPQNILPLLKMSFGARVLGLLVQQGLASTKDIPADTVFGLLGADPSKYSNKPMTYITFPHTAEGELTNEAKRIKDANIGSGNIVDRLFGIEKAPVIAETEPRKFSQKQAKRTRQDITQMQKKAVQKEMNTPYTIIPDMLDLAYVLDRERVLEVAGFVDLDKTKVHAINRKSVEAKNKSLEQQYDLMMDAHSEGGAGTPFFVTQNVWSNFRAGYEQQSLNPQGSKIHRAFFAHPGWTVTLDRNNPEHMQAFLISTAMNLGAVKTDQQPDAESLELFRKKLTDQDVSLEHAIEHGTSDLAKAIEHVRQALEDPESQQKAMSPETKDFIAHFAAKGEGMTSLQSLVALAKYKQAIIDKKNSFETTVLVGADGKTNGPMLTLLALGASSNADELYTMLNKGGFYKEEEATHFSEFYKDPASQDLYETLGTTLIQRALDRQKTPREINAAWDVYKKARNKKDVVSPWTLFTAEEFKAAEALTKVLRNDQGKASKAGRNLVKTPTTMFNYGSALSSAVRGMQNDFVAAYYSQLESFANNPNFKETDLHAFLAKINLLLKKGSPFEKEEPQPRLIPVDTKLDVLMQHPLDKTQGKALRKAFDAILGNSATTAMETTFSVLIERRTALNQSANASHALYQAAYQQARIQKINALMESGDIPSRTSKDEKIPLFDLSDAQEQEIREGIKGLLPVVHSAASKQEDNLDAGIYLAKQALFGSKSPLYEAQADIGVAISNGNITGKKSPNINMGAMTQEESAPGVAGLALEIQSSDSAIMHRALNDVDETLNVHDEGNNSVLKIQETALALNKHTAQVLLDYSPAREAVNLLERQLETLAQARNSGPSSLKAIVAGVEALAEVVNQRKDEPLSPEKALEALVKSTVDNAYAADHTRLSVLAKLQYVDQYTWEGGQYLVPQEMRDEAQKQLEALKEGIPASLQKSMDAVIKTYTQAKASPESLVVPGWMEQSEDTQDEQDASVTVKKTEDLGLPGVAAYSTLEALQHQLPEVAAAVAEGTSVVDAINQQEPIQRAETIETLARTAEKLPEELKNVFGILGEPVEASDPRWVSWFADKTEVTLKELGPKLAEAVRGEGNVKQFQKELLRQLYRQLPMDMKIIHVTKDTPASVLIGAEKISNNRGWYSVSGSKEAIYVLGQDYTHSYLTTEILLHELLHAALTTTLADDKSPEVQEILKDIDALMERASDFVKKNSLQDKFGRMLVNRDEFISWGMTNLEFQQQVLNNEALNSTPKTRKNVLVSAFKHFADLLVRLLYRGSEKSSQKIAVLGMTRLIHDVAGLLNQASKTNRNPGSIITHAMTASASRPETTQEIYARLTGGNITGAFDSHLQGIQAEIVEQLHGAFGSLKNALQREAKTNPDDIFTDALRTGVAPFASKTLASGFVLSQKEAFVIEQVEATLQTVLDSNDGQTAFAHRELSKLFDEARKKLTPRDFHQGDWAQASPDEQRDAKAKYDFVFALEHGKSGKLAHLSRFAALGLGSQFVNSLLQFETQRNQKTFKDLSVVEKLHEVFRRAMDWVVGKTTHTFAGQDADDKLHALVSQLIQIETKHLKRESGEDISWFDPAEKAIRGISSGIGKAVTTVSQSTFVKSSKRGIVRAAGAAVNASVNGRLGQTFAQMTEMRNRYNQEHQDIVSQTVDEIRGETDIKKPLFSLLRANKRREQQREELESLGSRNVLESFKDGGVNLSNEERSALGNVVLRTNAQVLLNTHTLPEIYTLLTNESARDHEIAKLEKQLNRFGRNKGFYRRQARMLAYYMATGKTKGDLLLKNSHAIANLAGTSKVNTVTKADAKEAEKLLEQLVSLWALNYSGKPHQAWVERILQEETNRGKENGVEFVLKYHQKLQQEAKESLFSDNPMLMMEGYVPEIYNPHVDVRVATEAEGALLVKQGYSEGGSVGYDQADPNRTPRRMYVLKGGGLSPWLSTSLSFTGTHAKGSRSASDSVKSRTEWISNQEDLNYLHQTKRKNESKLFTDDPAFDPRQTKGVFAAPVLNEKGEVVDYHYLMDSATKDSVLERDNRFDTLLGRLEGSQFDKASTVENNANVIKALYDQYQTDFAKHSELYREISLDSPIRAHRDLYQMLPEGTKKAIQEHFGTEPLMVRVDQIDLIFGYRKYNLGDAFTKDDDIRNAVENVFVDVMTYLMGEKAMVRVRRADDAWQLLVKEVKDIYVIKNVKTLLNNIKSNISELVWFGVPIKDIIHHHRVAMAGLHAYRRDNETLIRLRTQRDARYFPEDAEEMEREITRLEDALMRNPVYPLIQAGMMPTIVEDVGAEDPYSYKSFVKEKASKILKKINPTVKEIGKQVYMAHDTSMYKTLHYITQASDFVARYTLYQHLTSRKDMQETPEQALSTVSEAFVNYDILSHRYLRGMNDRGLVWFTSYHLRIQKVIARLFHEKPGRALAMVALGHYWQNAPILSEASFVHRMGNNPFSVGAFKYPGALDDLATVKAGLVFIN